MRSIKILTIVIFVFALSVAVYSKIATPKKVTQGNLRDRVYSYLKVEKNQKQVFNTAMALNDGKSANACVYFVSEVLRRNNIDISKDICNTSQIISILQKRGWKKDSDYRNLKPGDLCFTTDFKGNKNGVPTHTFIFMGWVKENSYDFAYICDNQAKDYNNKVFHIRNIKESFKQDGLTKDAFSFSMKP